MTDAEPRTTTGRGGLLGAFTGAMAGITEADVAAALDGPGSHLAAASPAFPAANASAAPHDGPSAGEPIPEPPEPVSHRVVDARAQAVADRLLGHVPATPAVGTDASSEPAPESARLVAAEGGAVTECAPGCAVVIGRADGDLVVPLGVVSRRHCQVSRIGDQYVLADLNSANGTLVCRPDGSTIEVAADSVELRPGDVIATARGRRPIARLEPAGSPP